MKMVGPCGSEPRLSPSQVYGIGISVVGPDVCGVLLWGMGLEFLDSPLLDLESAW